MKESTAIAMRANVVLFSISTGIASVPFLVIALLIGLPEGGIRALPYQVGVFAIALLIMGLLRWCARLACEAAFRAKLIRVDEGTEFRAYISPRCRHAWLVQLYVELRGSAMNASVVFSRN